MDSHVAALANIGLSGGVDGGDLTVTYAAGSALEGNILKPLDTASMPTVAWGGAESGSLHTLVCTDPDAISRENPIFREFIHWVVVNIPGSDVGAGETVASYIGPGPPFNSGLHSYVFLLYKQESKFDEATVAEATTYYKSRGGLKSHEYFGEGKGLGKPIGCRSFQAEWDDSIDELHEKIGFLPPEPYRSPSQIAKNP
jgi:phosphatidylethanolamine-binding protein (PEBP) family uncharacterized protein